MDRPTTSTGAIVGGTLSAVFLGFGTGQAIEGRWRKNGWLFTVADAVGLAAMSGAWGASFACCLFDRVPPERYEVMFWGGAALVVVSRIWQIVDATHGAMSHNAKVHELRYRYGLRDYAKTLAPYVSRPQAADGGMTFGVAMRF